MTPQLIVALDVPNLRELTHWVDLLGGEVSWYKVGLELFCAEGPGILEPLRERGKRIFLDLKLHDIPRTVERAVRSATNHGVDLLTLHACGGRAMMQAAAAAAAEGGADRPRLLAVTVLTSLDAADFLDLGLTRSPAEQVQAMGDLAVAAGIDGLVCSPLEVGTLRDHLGPDPLLVTPGIRLPGGEAGDQKRMATPEAAARAGASHLVVGRPILEAANPMAVARRITALIKS